MGTVMAPLPRVLHLFSEWKWTGPAEPIVNLCRHMSRRGYVVDLACTRPPKNFPQSLEHRARERRVEPVLDFNLDKGLNLFKNIRDIRGLAEFIDREEVQIVHVHTSHDHYLGSRAARRTNSQPRVVRSNHSGMPLPNTWANRRLIKGRTHGWVALTQSCLEEDAGNFGLDPAYGCVIEGAVDLERFNAEVKHIDMRPEFGLTKEHVVAGVVARVQKHRRFDVLLKALVGAMGQEPSLRALILGRGTHMDTLARQPAHELGIGDKVIFAGYRADDYPECLACFDFEIFLVPGSDGSCRAAREAMAMGKPIIAGRRGLLPLLVEDGKCGLVIRDSVANLTQAILRLARDRDLCREFGRAAAAKAQRMFNIERQVRTIGRLYSRLLPGA